MLVSGLGLTEELTSVRIMEDQPGVSSERKETLESAAFSRR